MNNYGKACKLCTGWKGEHMTSNHENKQTRKIMKTYENLENNEK